MVYSSFLFCFILASFHFHIQNYIKTTNPVKCEGNTEEENNGYVVFE